MMLTSKRLYRWLLICHFFLLSPGITGAAEPEPIPLWEKGAPGSEARKLEPEKIDQTNGKFDVTNVHNPSLTAYLPKPEKATGTAIIIAPGGGHRVLCLGHEGGALGQWLADHGIAAFVLRYRLAREAGSSYSVDEHAMLDTRRAIRTVRSRASQWQINPERIGILGFSAGGELAALAAMQSDMGDPNASDPAERASSRPDFQVLIYPGSSKRFTVQAGMPPAFIALGENDRPDISLGMAELYMKYKAAGVPCELHIYSGVGHGFGFRPTNKGAVAAWPTRMQEWLAAKKLL
ncbi:MAG: alpha/beta hydrolase [Pirellulaceae bacterium]|nr:alpha/beta hydrolase [Pirellulaceae bacterium]